MANQFPISQQKKILKFQMRILQEAKVRHAKALRAIPKDPQVDIFSNPSVEPKPVVAPQTTAALTTSNTLGPANPQIVQPPMVSIQQSEPVETVFHIDDNRTITATPPASNVQQQQQNKGAGIPKPHKMAQMSVDHLFNQYGYKYEKGIPRSFLLQQRRQRSASSTLPDGPIWPTMVPSPAVDPNAASPLLVDTDAQGDVQQPYSPSELYAEFDQPANQDGEDQDSSENGQRKRLSVFRRLGPQKQAKTPKLTINLTVNDDQEVREVVNETEELEEETPVHLRQDIILSTDPTVMKHLKSWPWKKNVVVKKNVTARSSKTVMILEREQMEEIYDKESLFIQVTVTDYPRTWTKEQVLDLLMENIRGYSFIPCFIEFNKKECKFLTLRCRSALLSLHKCGFVVRKDDIQLTISISQTELTLHQIDFVPRLVLRKRLAMSLCSENETKLDLTAFTLKEDISHFIYFPLNRLNNQSEIVQMQSYINWSNLTDLNLSHNRISSLDGFDLEQTTPKLKHLNLSFNCINKVTSLLKCRELPLKTIHLEGNPLCTDYTDPDQYVKIVKLMFSGVTMIDDIPVRFKGEMPKFIRNYCPPEANQLVEKFLEIYFPLLDGTFEHRTMLQEMYEDNANMTITYHYKLAFSPIYRCFKTLFQNSRQLEQDNMNIIKGSSAIIKTIVSWPHTEHDPFTFTVDVLYQNDTTAIVRIGGIFKLTRETLAEDEYLLAFSKTLILHTRDYVEYKIQAEMLYWSIPDPAYAKSAFTVTAVNTKQMNPKIDSTTDEKLQGELLKIFMKLTSMNKKDCEKCLEIKKWNLKDALDHFTKLLKLDCLDLTKEVL